ncbi:MAG: AAA family ATPase [Oscillospiraceae bacterium]
MKQTHFFLGANSAEGFYGLYDQLLDARLYDLIILKGTPGCGKSTFMRRVAAALEERELETVYIHCSGDPESLDGVIAPAIRTAIVDGTAPHVLEPRYALAHERYVDLSQCCDSAAAKEVANGLTALTDAYRASYREAYHVLRALGSVDAERRALVRAHFDEEKLLRRAAGIAARELKGGGEMRGRAADVFLGGLTCQGKVCRFDSVDALCPRVYELCDSYGLAAPVLRLLRDAALEAGEDVLACRDRCGPRRLRTC